MCVCVCVCVCLSVCLSVCGKQNTLYIITKTPTSSGVHHHASTYNHTTITHLSHVSIVINTEWVNVFRLIEVLNIYDLFYSIVFDYTSVASKFSIKLNGQRILSIYKVRIKHHGPMFFMYAINVKYNGICAYLHVHTSITNMS